MFQKQTKVEQRIMMVDDGQQRECVHCGYSKEWCTSMGTTNENNHVCHGKHLYIILETIHTEFEVDL
jgi:hypothetical protein